MYIYIFLKSRLAALGLLVEAHPLFYNFCHDKQRKVILIPHQRILDIERKANGSSSLKLWKNGSRWKFHYRNFAHFQMHMRNLTRKNRKHVLPGEKKEKEKLE